MSEEFFWGYSLKNIFSNNKKNTAIDNMFSKYKIKTEEEKLKDSRQDNLKIGELMKAAIDNILDPTSAMTEEEKQNFVAKMQRKIKMGEKLTADEMQYLRMNDPMQYIKMSKVQMQREILEKRLENCKSKEEAQEVYADAMLRISKEDVARTETIAAYNNVYEEFKKSNKYETLPETKEEAEEDSGKHNCIRNEI